MEQLRADKQAGKYLQYLDYMVKHIILLSTNGITLLWI